MRVEKNAFVASEFFIHIVGNFVCSQTQIGLRDSLALRSQINALDHIPQAHAHIVATIGQATDAAGQQGIGILLPPVGEVGAGSLI